MSVDLKHTLQKLQAYKKTSTPILSVYLPVAKESSKKQRIAMFRSLCNRALEETERRFLANIIQSTEGFLQQYVPGKNVSTLAIFAGDNTIWEMVETHFKLPLLLALNHSPYLTPIVEELEGYRRYLVVLADRVKTKFTTLHMGELEDQTEVKDDKVPQKVRERSMNNRVKNIDRYIQDHFHRHFVHVSKQLNQFIRQKYIDGIVIAGHKETINNVKKHLPKGLQTKILGEIQAEPDAGMNELLRKSKQIIQQTHRTFDLRMGQFANLT